MTEVINFPTSNTQGFTDTTGVSAPEVAVASTPQNKTVTFRGQEVTLKYTLLSLQRLEKAGVSLTDLEKIGDEISVTMLGKVLWAGLCVQFNDATIDEVLNSFEISELQQVSDAMAAALSNTVGK
ncbi:hypothetical protein [Enterococcus sp.]|uniref:hypothetical protein n=1 Tax=Enterococcus sp. TaxID=35783 RepID=UPI002FC7C3EB